VCSHVTAPADSLISFPPIECSHLVKSSRQPEQRALLRSHQLSRVVRYGVLLVCLGDIALFASSEMNASKYATVGVEVVLSDQRPHVIPNLYVFTLSRTIREMWDAQAYYLSAIVAVFIGFWPCARLSLVLMCWVLPSRILPVKYRGNILRFLDFLGKWSFTDIFVLSLLLVATRIDLQLPGALVQVYCQPEWGCYGFLMAIIISIGISHVALYFHRVAGHMMDDKPSSQRCVQQSLGASTDMRAHTITALLAATLILLIVGSTIVSFSFEFGGAAAKAFDYLNHTTKTDYSIITLGTQIPWASHSPDFIGTYFIQFSFYLFCVLVPVLHLVAMGVLWNVPFARSTQQKLYKACEVLLAWSSVDVFVVALLVQSYQLELVVKFILGDNCDAINHILKEYLSDIFPNPQCFTVVAELQFGFWILFSAVVVYYLTGGYVMLVCHQCMKDSTTDLDGDSRIPILFPRAEEETGTSSDKSERKVVVSKTTSLGNVVINIEAPTGLSKSQ